MKFYKGRSQEKTHLHRLEFFLLRSPLDRARSVLTDRAMCSVACGGLGFLYQRFSSLLRDEACQFRNQQSRTVVKFGDHGSIGDSWPIAFSGCPRGTRVGCETCARGTQRLTNQLRLALEPESISNPTATAQGKFPEMERTRFETLKLFVVSDVGRRSSLLSSTRSTRWWQSSWPRSDAPSPAGCPWSTKRCRTPEMDRVCSKPRSPHP